MRTALKFLAVGVALSLPACATALRGPNVDFQVVTDPPGASVTTDLTTYETRREIDRRKELVRLGFQDEIGEINMGYFGCEATPCTLKLARRSNFTATIELEGYHPATVEVTSGFGQGGATRGAAGTAAAATGAYIVAYNAVHLVGSVATLGLASTGAVASSAAGSAATGVGVAFLGVDVLTGAMLDLQPNPLVLVMVPEDQPLPEEGQRLIETEEQWEQILRDREAAQAANTANLSEPVSPS